MFAPDISKGASFGSKKTKGLHLFSSFSAPLLLSLHLTLVRCGERKGGPEKVEKEREASHK